MMSSVFHDAIVVTTWSRIAVEEAHAKAVDLGLPVTNIVDAPVNGYASFVVVPHGSKFGWPEEKTQTAARYAFKEWLRDRWRQSCDFQDRTAPSSFPEFVHVVFGSEYEGENGEGYADIVDTQPDKDSPR